MKTREKLILYLSIAPELRFEREVIGRAIAEIPTSLGWQIAHTPWLGQDTDLNTLLMADIHIMVLGSDIYAPIGWECMSSGRAGKHIHYLLKKCIHTQSAIAFMRDIHKNQHTKWIDFADMVQLRGRVLNHVTDFLLQRAHVLSIGEDEMNKLLAWRNDIGTGAKNAVDDRLGGADESGVILSLQRFTPSGGKLIDTDLRNV
jgi:hypothetical protein